MHTEYQYSKFRFIYLFNGQTVNGRASYVGMESTNPRPDKSYTALQTADHRFNIYASTVAVLLGAMMRS